MDIEGELFKKGQKRTALGDSWKKRRFTFSHETRTLRYFEGAPGAKPLGELKVRGIDAREELQGTAHEGLWVAAWPFDRHR